MLRSTFNNTPIPKDFEFPFLKQNHIIENGALVNFKGKFTPIYSPIQTDHKDTLLGSIPNMNSNDAKNLISQAHLAFNYGLGTWPSNTPESRIQVIKSFISALKPLREEISKLIMWEIGKTYGDCLKEFDRTISFMEDSINSYLSLLNKPNILNFEISLKPYGVVFCLSPYNFPFNETLSLVIPALLTGNTIILKPAKFGVLLLTPLLTIFKDIFPKGVINILYSNNKKATKTIIKSGKIDVLALIGNRKTAQKLQSFKPKQQLLRTIFSLEAKNPGIIFPDCDMEKTVEVCALGTLAFNGQRCTALKSLFVHQDILGSFIKKFCSRINQFKVGLPWEEDVFLTPLPPEKKKMKYLKNLIQDAKKKGAKIINSGGGQTKGNFMNPAILSPVNSTMRIFHEEQFGPIVPIIPFKNKTDLMELLKLSEYGQQASLFSSIKNQENLIQFLQHQFGRVNLNKLCQRGPDILPFSGRKNSASFSLGVKNTIRCFSIEVVLDT